MSDPAELRLAQLSCGDGATCHLYRRSDGSPLGVCELPEEGACSHRFDCAAGEWCSLPSDWQPGRWGDCRPLKADGWHCDGDLECESSFCQRGTCAPAHAERFCAATTYSGVVLADGPIGYWRLGDVGSTTALDEGIGGHAGTYQGSPEGTDGVLQLDDDGALALDGVDDGVVLGEVGEALDTEVSLELWYRRSPASETGPLLEFATEEEIGIRLWSHDAADKVHVNFRDRGGNNHGYTTDEGVIEADTWYHVVATYDGEGLRLYVDGNQLGETLTESFRPLVDGVLRIGLREGDERHLIGAIDEVAVYDRALTRTQIRRHRNRAAGPVPQDFVLFRWL